MAVDTTQPSTTAPSLSFPRDIFAALSPAPFLLAHLAPESNSSSSQPSVRPNGRTCSEFRAPSINTSSLTHSAGSAVVRLGDSAVVCGVRGEILRRGDVPNTGAASVDGGADEKQDEDEAEDEAEDDKAELESLGLLVPNIELATGSTPSHVPGQPPSAQAQSLTARLLALLLQSRVLRARDLRVVYEAPRTAEDEEDESVPRREVKAYWTLYIDVLFISLDGNAFDAAWGAVLAALKDTVLPRAWWDPDLDAVLCSDAVGEAKRLSLRGLPVAASFAVFTAGLSTGRSVRVLGLENESERGAGGEERAWILADPDAFEESNCQEVVCVVLDCSTGNTVLHKIEKNGGGVVGKKVLRSVVNRAEERWREWYAALSQGGS